MKTVVDYLKANKQYETSITQWRNGTVKTFTITLLLNDDNIVVTCGDDISFIKEIIKADSEAEYNIQNILEYHKLEIRFCEECGKPYDAGYTVDGGFWYCCEECFEEVMNRDYGKGKWRGTNKEGEQGGFYEALNDNGEWEDTGVYYTEWN